LGWLKTQNRTQKSTSTVKKQNFVNMAAAAAKIPTVVCDMETTTPAARKKKQRTKHPAPARKSPVKTRSRTAEAEKVAEQEAVESYRMSFTAPAPVPDDVDRFFLPEYLERPKTPEFVLEICPFNDFVLIVLTKPLRCGKQMGFLLVTRFSSSFNMNLRQFGFVLMSA
jgi:hypothetical protein